MALRSEWSWCCGLRMHARISTLPPGGLVPVVLVHGLAVSSRYMIPLANELAADHPVFVPDLPAFGRSQRPPQTPTVENLAGYLGEWMRLHGIGRAVLVGNSMGCQIMVEFARRYRDMVVAGVMLGPTMDPSGSFVGQAIRLLADQFFEPLSLIALQAFEYVNTGPVITARVYMNAYRHPMRARLAAFDAPALVLRGERDTIVSREWAEEVARRLPQGRLEEIAGAGHAINYNSAKQVGDAVRRFVAGLR